MFQTLAPSPNLHQSRSALLGGLQSQLNLRIWASLCVCTSVTCNTCPCAGSETANVLGKDTSHVPVPYVCCFLDWRCQVSRSQTSQQTMSGSAITPPWLTTSSWQPTAPLQSSCSFMLAGLPSFRPGCSAVLAAFGSTEMRYHILGLHLTAIVFAWVNVESSLIHGCLKDQYTCSSAYCLLNVCFASCASLVTGLCILIKQSKTSLCKQMALEQDTLLHTLQSSLIAESCSLWLKAIACVNWLVSEPVVVLVWLLSSVWCHSTSIPD